MTEERLRELIEREGLRYVRPVWGQGLGERLQLLAEREEALGVVVPGRTDTKWFHEHCTQHEIRFLRGRLRMNGHKSAAPFPSVVIVMGPGARAGEVVWWGAAR